MIDEKNKMKSI